MEKFWINRRLFVVILKCEVIVDFIVKLWFRENVIVFCCIQFFFFPLNLYCSFALVLQVDTEMLFAEKFFLSIPLCNNVSNWWCSTITIFFIKFELKIVCGKWYGVIELNWLLLKKFFRKCDISFTLVVCVYPTDMISFIFILI